MGGSSKLKPLARGRGKNKQGPLSQHHSQTASPLIKCCFLYSRVFFHSFPPPLQIIKQYSFPHSNYVHLSACDFWQMDRKWLNLAKAIYSGLHNIPFISTPPPCSDCHHLIYMKIDKMPSVGLSLLLSFPDIAGSGKHMPTSWKHHRKAHVFLSPWAAVHSHPDNFLYLLEKTKPV